MRVAFYRVLYGDEFINASIKSIIDDVDKVVVFLADKPWGSVDRVTYLGETIKFPFKFDNVEEQVALLDSSKIEVVHKYMDTPKNQHKLLMDELDKMYKNIELYIAIEPDMIHTKGIIENEALFYTTRQIEFWRTYDYRIPQRDRPGPIYYKKVPRRTEFNGIPEEAIWVCKNERLVYNMGFAYGLKTMLNKHLTSLAFSAKIGDSIPNERWLEDVWLAWRLGSKNLGISKNHAGAIPAAFRTHVMTSGEKEFIDENRPRT